jgi:6-pyruvoyltetrahydropterin/6-carboxytetrahydropterin synthase
MHVISKEFHFSASHILQGLKEGHPCGRLHGHNYILKVFLKGEPDEVGFVQDYNDLKPIKDYVDNELDHRHLNDIFMTNPTVENMTKFLFHKFKPQFPKMYALSMSETPKTNCYYEPTY